MDSCQIFYWTLHLSYSVNKTLHFISNFRAPKAQSNGTSMPSDPESRNLHLIMFFSFCNLEFWNVSILPFSSTCILEKLLISIFIFHLSPCRLLRFSTTPLLSSTNFIKKCRWTKWRQVTGKTTAPLSWFVSLICQGPP